MKKLYSTLAILALSAAAVHAEDTWLLGTYETEAKDSVEANALYGYQTFQNKSSAVTINVTGGSVNLVATKLASDGTEGYTANIGMLLPLTPDWSEHDLTGLTSITFDYQNDVKITDVLSVSFGSTAYSDAIASAGTVFSNDISGSTALAGGTSWKQGEVLLADFVTPSWWTDIPTDFPIIDTVLKHVKNLQFAPKTAYLSKAGSQKGVACQGACVDPSMKSITLKVKNIVLHGVKNKPWPNPTNLGCEEGKPFTALSDFASGRKNAFGGYFFTFSDFDSTGTATDPAKGASEVSDSLYEEGFLVMSAKLKKKVGGTYHKYSGWADIGTDFKGKASLNATGLTAIGFQLADAGGINDKLIESIIFKVKIKGVSDTALHQVNIPAADIVAAASAGKQVCIRPADLAQASYVAAAHKVAFKPNAIQQLSWEVKITDDRSSAIDTATANLLLSNVILYGSDAFELNKDVGVLDHSSRSKTSVSYANGALILNGFVGASHFEVRDLSGKVVASFDAAKRVSFDLNRGTYLLSAKGEKVSYTSKFTVFGR